MEGYQLRGTYHVETPLGLQVTPALIKALGGRRIADAYDYSAYDRLRYKAGADTPTNTQRLFTSGVGQQVSVVNAAENYTKDYFDTNQQEGNRLARGNYLVVDSIQIKVSMTGELDTTYPTSGAGTELATSTVGAAIITGTNLFKALQEQTYIQFWVGEKAYEEGLIEDFPCEAGISGFAGSGGTTLTSQTVLNNGFGYCRKLAMQRLIPELVNFRVDLRHLQALTITRQFTLKCSLKGILYRPVQ